jgi:hypothetical protein
LGALRVREMPRQSLYQQCVPVRLTLRLHHAPQPLDPTQYVICGACHLRKRSNPNRGCLKQPLLADWRRSLCTNAVTLEPAPEAPVHAAQASMQRFQTLAAQAFMQPAHAPCEACGPCLHPMPVSTNLCSGSLLGGNGSVIMATS